MAAKKKAAKKSAKKPAEQDNGPLGDPRHTNPTETAKQQHELREGGAASNPTKIG